MTLENSLATYGLLTNQLIMDGDLHRCGTTRKPKDKNGWYIIYDAGKAAVFGNWEHGDGYEKWRGEGVSDVDWYKIQARIDEAKLKREEQFDIKAAEAIAYINSCSRDGFSDYLKNKQIYPHGVRFDGNCIVIPLQDATGKIWSYQKIYGDGSKYFMSGGKVSGCYYLIASRNIAKDELVIVCEGFATGASIHQETGSPVVVAFNAGNLKKVADSLVFRNLTIAADNDKSGVGEKYAKESGYKWIMPDKEGCDFNDLRGDIKRYFVVDSAIGAAGVSSELAVHGLVKDIADWITATAIRPQPVLSIAAALGFVAMIKGHKICGGTDLRTNLLILSLAPTGSGKEHPQNCIRKLAQACMLDKHMMGEPVSGGGFLTGLLESNRVGLLVMDEMGRFVGNISNKNSGGWQKEIVDYIIKTFSCANSVLYGRQHVDTKKNPRIDINQPHFCCVGSTVQEKMQAACTSGDVLDGFLNRWLVFNTKNRVERNDYSIKPTVPQELIEKIKEITGHGIKYNNYGEPEPVEVKFTPEAWDLFVSYRNRIDALVKKVGFPLDALYNRSAEHVEKVALVLCDNEDIMCQDVQAAINIVEQSNNAILEFAGMITDNVQEQDFVRVRDKIKTQKEIKRSDLTYSCQFVQGGAKRISEIITVLLDKNIIAERKDGNKTFYKWIG
jgi:putative DNA primase/helicase